MTVLSLFDGISCARVALDRLGIDCKYYASEVDKSAIDISCKNYPDTIQLGDVRNISKDMFNEPIDLLIGGSPCQDLSIAKANRKGLDGERSGLFWEYVRILHQLKPKYFVLENVNSMPNDAKNQISTTLGVQPIMINAALVSGQNRKRLFWTNIPNIEQPIDRNVEFSSILEDLPFRELKPFCFINGGYGLSGMKSICDKKSNTLTTSNTHSKMYLLNADKTLFRTMSPIEFERLQSLDDNYTKYGVSGKINNTNRYKCLGNAFNVEVVKHILSYIDYGKEKMNEPRPESN